MNLEKVIFGFFIVLAATLNFGFFIGDLDNPIHHDVYEPFAAIVVNLIATVLKFGDRTPITNRFCYFSADKVILNTVVLYKVVIEFREMKYFQELVSVRANDIVQKWIDFFVLHKSIKPERITGKIP